MIIASQQKRRFWFDMMLRAVPNLIISAIAASLVDNPVFVFIAVFLFLEFIPLLFSIRDAIWSWIIFYLRGKKQRTLFIFDFLTEHNFPEPDEYVDDIDEFFTNIMNDESLEATVRMSASACLAEIILLRSFQFVNFGIQLQMVYEEAIQKYKRTFSHGTANVSSD